MSVYGAEVQLPGERNPVKELPSNGGPTPERPEYGSSERSSELGSDAFSETGDGISIFYHLCPGCSYSNRWSWIDFGVFEWVKVDYAKTQSPEPIEELQVHGTLMRKEGSFQCPHYADMENVWTVGPTYAYNNTLIQIGPSGYYYGDNDTWTLATGHSWKVNSHYTERSDIDQCRNF